MPLAHDKVGATVAWDRSAVLTSKLPCPHPSSPFCSCVAFPFSVDGKRVTP